MVRYTRKQRIIAVIFGILSVVACSNGPGSSPADSYLIRVGEKVITAQDFDDAFEIAKVAYPHNALQDPAVGKEVRRRLLNQLADEMVLFARAEVLNISLSDAELEAAVDAVKADYPEGMFQQALLESAISFASWENRLRSRLLIEKVIEKDLTQQIDITPQDVVSYYGMGDSGGGDGDDDSKTVDKASIGYMRRTKAEAVYYEWMKALKQTHGLEINQKLWEKISGME